MKNNIKVSIVTAVFNGEKYISRCINSVRNQNYDNVEYIVIDGGSSDGTIDIVKQNEEVVDYWVSEDDEGVYDAMNKGIRRATGDVIGLLNADDYYEEDTLQIVAEKNEKNPESIIVGAMNRILPDGSTYTLRRRLSQQGLDSAIYYRTPMNHPATFVPASVYDQIGLFDPSIKISSDYDLICRAYQADVPFVFVDRVLTNMQAGGMSSGTNHALLRAQEFYEIRSKNNLVSPVRNLWLSTWWFLATMAKEGIKNILPEALNASLYRARHGTPSRHS